MKIYQTSSLEISCDHEHKRLFLRCLDELSSSEFREGLVKALDCAEKEKIKHWLLDLREIGELNEEEEVWLQRYLFPSIMAKVGTGNYVAMVLSEKCFEVLLHEAGMYGLESYNEVIIIKTFYEPEDAMKWLDASSSDAA